MYIGANSFLFDRTGHDLVRTVEFVASRGVRYLDISSNPFSNPQDLSAGRRRKVARALRDNAVAASQMLLIKTWNIASSSAKERASVQKYMRKCAEFQREMGGKQVVVCVAGVLETGVAVETTWCRMLEALGEYADWCAGLDLLVGVEIEPHVYYLLNDSWKLYRALTQLGRSNFYANIDIGHFLLTREAPECLDKFAGALYHGHLSETDGLSHSNSILGDGKVDFSAYLRRCRDLGMEDDCRRAGIDPVFCMEISEAGSLVESAEEWFDRSLEYVRKHVPELSL